jgi:hypothetical protein
MDSGKKAVIGGGVFARNQRGRSKCLQAPARDYGLIFDLALEASDIGNTSGTISSGLRLVSYYIYIRHQKTIASITTLCRQSLGFICFSAECVECSSGGDQNGGLHPAWISVRLARCRLSIRSCNRLEGPKPVSILFSWGHRRQQPTARRLLRSTRRRPW